MIALPGQKYNRAKLEIMLLLRGALLFLLIVTTYNDASEKPAITVNRIRGLSPDTFQTNGSNKSHCIANNSSEQDRRHCSRSGDFCPNWFTCNDTTAGI